MLLLLNQANGAYLLNVYFTWIYFTAKLLVATGWLGYGEVLAPSIEIIDLADNSTECEPWLKLAFPVRGAVAGFIDGGVLICGGSKGNDSFVTNQCQHIKPLQSVITSTNISHASFASSSIVYDNSLFITGGYNPHGTKKHNLVLKIV